MSENYKDIMKLLNQTFNFKWSEQHNAYLLDVTAWMDELLLAEDDEWDPEDYRDITEFIKDKLENNNSLIQLREPSYGWQGDVTTEI